MKKFVSIILILTIIFVGYINAYADRIDQQQTEANKSMKIYGNKWFAQSFTPTEDKITRIKLKLGKIERKSIYCGLLARERWLKKFFERFFDRWKKPKELVVSIRDSLNGEDLAIATISFEKVINNSWIEFDFNDIYVINETYYIVCHTNEGNEKNCYLWFCSDENPYRNGSMYFSLDGIEWEKNENIDFCFQIFGKDKDADNITNYWAIIIGIENYEKLPKAHYAIEDANDMKNVLIENGWERNHIKLLLDSEATKKSIYDAIKWMDKMEDEDDVTVFFFSGWGDINRIISYDNVSISSSELDKWLNKIASPCVIILESWYSGSLLKNLSKSGRIIMASANEHEESWRYSVLGNSVFVYYLVAGLDGGADENNDKIVTAEEAFYYAEYLTRIFERPQHPQIYDGYDGELPITFIE